jgi:transposase
MAEQDRIIMNQKESNRLHAIRQAIDRAITQAQAALLVGVTERQVRRMVKRVRREGNGGICHQSRGKRSNNLILEKIKDKAIDLCRTRYVEFGPTHAGEKLLQYHQIEVSTETLRGWFNQEEVSYRKRKKRPHRQWRPRKEYRGEMVQMDGSHHNWFEGRGPVCVLMGYVDDATGEVYARFYEYEGTLPAMDSFKRYIKRYGIPHSVYLDRHSTYKVTEKKQTLEEQLADIQPMSHFEKSLAELVVVVIHAGSPQAKGRIERQFGTFQDRVVKEMRLAGVTNIVEGNVFLDRYLPEYNRMFARKAAQKANYHRPVANKRALDRILAIKTPHALRNDFTITHNRKLYQVDDTIRAKKVTVEERTDGTLHLIHNDQHLRYHEIDIRPAREKKKTKRPRPRLEWKPRADHPWQSPAKAMLKARRELQATT